MALAAQKIMVFVPLYPRGTGIPPRERITRQTVESVERLAWKGQLTLVFDREDNPEHGGYPNVLRKYQYGRDLALAGGFDGLLTVEADMVIPPLALERLVRLPCDVAYGLYASRHGKHQWLAFTRIEGVKGESLSKMPELAQKLWGSAVVTEGVGLGCTLIHRTVLEQIPFRVQENGAACDWALAQDLKEAGMRQMHDLGVVCGHVTDKGSVIWPDIEQPELVREDNG